MGKQWVGRESTQRHCSLKRLSWCSYSTQAIHLTKPNLSYNYCVYTYYACVMCMYWESYIGLRSYVIVKLHFKQHTIIPEIKLNYVFKTRVIIKKLTCAKISFWYYYLMAWCFFTWTDRHHLSNDAWIWSDLSV